MPARNRCSPAASATLSAGCPARRPGGAVERNASHEHAQMPEERLLGRRQEIVAPADSRVETALPVWQVMNIRLERLQTLVQAAGDHSARTSCSAMSSGCRGPPNPVDLPFWAGSWLRLLPRFRLVGRVIPTSSEGRLVRAAGMVPPPPLSAPSATKPGQRSCTRSRSTLEAYHLASAGRSPDPGTVCPAATWRSMQAPET